MLLSDIGRYTYVSNVFGSYGIFNSDLPPAVQSDIDDKVKSYDNMLHQSLDEIIHESCSNSSSHIQEFLRSVQMKCIIKSILDQESILSKHFSKKELDKLSLLWISALAGYEKSAELLVRFGADVDEPFGRRHPQVIDEKWTILHVLIQKDSSPENERLIFLIADRSTDLKVQDFQGQTVLHYAVECGRVQVTEMLLEKGVADINVINAANNDGVSLLILAVCNNHSKAKELVSLLVKHGADIFVKSSRGENVLHYLAQCYAKEDTIDLVVDLARFFIDKGVSLEEKQHEHHFRPIHLAPGYRNNKLVKLYLDHGANVNAISKQGESPLYLAAEIGQNIMVKTMLERGANIHLRTKKGRTALHAVCQCSSLFPGNEKCCEIIIRLLLSAGADVLDEDNDGKTPFALISSNEDGEQPGQKCWPLIEALALKKALQPSIELKDEMIIERYQKLRDYYQKCTDEIDRMKSTRFSDSCTFFELFAKSRCQIAALMRNPEFETKFRSYDLNDKFCIYAEDIRRAFGRTLKHHHSLLEQENVINEAVYNILPDLVVKKVVHYIINCCENV